jgi:hypothetical protein
VALIVLLFWFLVDAHGRILARSTPDPPVLVDEEARPIPTSLPLGLVTAAKSEETLSLSFGADVTPEYDTTTTDGVAQLIAVGILEFGVIMHSVFIGLTLVVNEEFTTLFVVIIFHRECEV